MKKILAALSATLLPVLASAGTLLTYTGNLFTDVNPTYGYSTSNRVTASISLSSALGTSLTNFNATSLITDWRIADGVIVVNSSTTTPAFVVSTDSAGAILAWDFTAYDCVRSGVAQIETSYGLPGLSPCGTLQDFDLSSISFTAQTASVRNNQPGTWVVTEVPEPDPLLLLVLGLGAIYGSMNWSRASRRS